MIFQNLLKKIIAGRPRDSEDIKSLILKNPKSNFVWVLKKLEEFDLSLQTEFKKTFEKILKETKPRWTVPIVFSFLARTDKLKKFSFFHHKVGAYCLWKKRSDFKNFTDKCNSIVSGIFSNAQLSGRCSNIFLTSSLAVLILLPHCFAVLKNLETVIQELSQVEKKSPLWHQ